MTPGLVTRSVRSANMDVLSRRFPHVHVPQLKRTGRFVVRDSEFGEPTLQMLNADDEVLWVHSRFDPRAEGEKLALQWDQGRGLYIVVGLGLGYHIEALTRRIPAGSSVLVVEPDWELFDVALDSVPLSTILEYPKLNLAVGNELNLVNELQRLNVTALPLKPRICIHPALERADRERYQRWQEVIRGEFSRLLTEAATMIRWDLTWGRNTMSNLPHMLRGRPVNILFNRFRDIPGIIVAAGPSLDINVDILRLAKGRAVIIAVGTALKALQSHGIQPDMVTSYDGGEANHRHFEGVTYDAYPLVYDPMIYPAIPEQHRGPQWIMETNSNPFMVWLREILGSPGFIASGGSIATAGLDLAVKMGCNPLILVGQDLAYREGRTHARGTAYGSRAVGASKLRDGITHLRVPSIDGGTVWTSRSWYTYLTWFERYIAAAPSHLHFLDATEGGALIHGTEVIRLRDAIEAFCRQKVDVHNVLASAAEGYRGPSATAEHLTRYLERGLESLREVSRATRHAAERTEEAQRLYQLGRWGGGRMKKILRALDKTDRFLKTLDGGLRGLIEMSAYQPALRIARAGQRDLAQGLTTSVPEPVSALDHSLQLYQGIARAAERTIQVIQVGLARLA